MADIIPWYEGGTINVFSNRAVIDLPHAPKNRRFVVYFKDYSGSARRKVIRLLEVCEWAVNDLKKTPQTKPFLGWLFDKWHGYTKVMALIYKCDYCGNRYKASYNGKVVYEDGNKRIPLTTEKEACYVCEQEAETAKKQALEKRKANYGKII